MAHYDHIVAGMKNRYEIRVQKWRQTMTGCAWRVYHNNGGTVNWIESPYPKTAISLAIFLHEVGHHAIGFRTFKKRCEEEYHVWQWALKEMRKWGVTPDARVMRRVDRSMRYAVAKAIRRGVQGLRAVLLEFVPQQ